MPRRGLLGYSGSDCLLLVCPMLPQVGNSRLGSYHKKVDARNQKSAQRPNQEPLDEVGSECHCSNGKPYRGEVEASPQEGVAPFLV
jgi:hypothetical protein